MFLPIDPNSERASLFGRPHLDRVPNPLSEYRLLDDAIDAAIRDVAVPEGFITRLVTSTLSNPDRRSPRGCAEWIDDADSL